MSSPTPDAFTPLNSGSQSIPAAIRPLYSENPWWVMPTEWSNDQRLRAAAVAILIAVASHWLWLRGEGVSDYAGFAAFIATASLLLVAGIRGWGIQQASDAGNRNAWNVSLVGTSCFVVIACLRMVWQGNVAVAAFTCFWIGVLSLCLHRRSLEFFNAFFVGLQSMIDGATGWLRSYESLPFLSRWLRAWPWLAWGIPILIGSAFLVPLLLAHPDLIRQLSIALDRWITEFGNWIWNFHFFESWIALVVLLMSMGMLLPSRSIVILRDDQPEIVSGDCSELHYLLVRNTLVAVIGVFSVFLMYEWSSLWFRVFPPNFYYSGYAHQGAAWLTVALAMSTATLLVLFSARVHAHKRIVNLRRLALLWFVCNLLLVIAVYHRLAIYVDFNGLTRMRIVGFVGVTCVLAGFLVALQRVTRAKGWKWVIHRQIWTLAISLFALSVLPMDWISHRWNVASIASGNFEPAVQFATHEVSDEGLLCLFELADSPQEVLRQGVLALLAARSIELTSAGALNDPRPLRPVKGPNDDWRAFQGSTHLLEKKLTEIYDDLEPYFESATLQQNAWKKFYDWAYQWY